MFALCARFVWIGDFVVYYLEDDENIRELTLYALKQAHIDASGFENATSFRCACQQRRPDAVLLDVMLPQESGLDVLKWMKSFQKFSDIPVMMITAKDTEMDIVQALDLGADDYLRKPFGVMEMVSRTKALLRRSERSRKQQKRLVYKIHDLLVDATKRKIKICDKELEFTTREFDLLLFFLQHPNIAYSRDALMQEVWGWEYNGGSRTVDVHVKQLRQKLPHIVANALITIRGTGYCFDMPDDEIECYEI